jgi:hypothetical protein
LIKVAISLLLPILALAVGPQDIPSIEQTHFCIECEIEHPVPISAAALETLQVTKDENGEHEVLEGCAKEQGISVRDVPESWFVASQVTLKRSEAPGLIVQSKNACLWGAHIGPFWLLDRSNAGYRLLFAGRADGFDVLRHYTNGYPDLELIFVLQAGKFIGYSKFCYEGGKYRLCGKRTERNPL